MTPGSRGAYWRVRWAAMGAVLALAVVGLAWLLVMVVKSPQDALASAAAPPPSRITVPVEKRALDFSVTAVAHLASADRVEGTLSVDQRARARAAARITVMTARGKVAARLQTIEPDGAFVLDLAAALPADAAPDEGPVGADGSVRVVFAPAEPAPSALVVPISALFTSSAGATAVVKVESGVEQEVAVRADATVDGFVAVSPTDVGNLDAGDEVLVSEPSS